ELEGYTAAIEGKMPRFFRWVSEQDRRRDAAIEAATLGQGGMESSARGLACEPNPRRPGLHALAAREAAAAGRLRPTGLAARRAEARRRAGDEPRAPRVVTAASRAGPPRPAAPAPAGAAPPPPGPPH